MRKIRRDNSMNDSATPRPYEQWRKVPIDRAEDAAFTFGYYLMKHCRTEALKASDSATLPTTAQELDKRVAQTVDIALHNLMDLLEGFWRTEAGANHTAEYALSVCVKDANG